MRPVGEARGLVGDWPGQPFDQRLIADRIAKAAHHRGHLGIEHRVRHITGQVKENLEILACRVEHLEGRGIGHQRQERRQIDPSASASIATAFSGRPPARRRGSAIGPLAHELGIDGNETARLSGWRRRR